MREGPPPAASYTIFRCGCNSETRRAGARNRRRVVSLTQDLPLQPAPAGETPKPESGSIPVIVVIWEDCETGYPEDYIQKCIEAFERFEFPEEIYQTGARGRSCFASYMLT
jgi:hypothetical protein